MAGRDVSELLLSEQLPGTVGAYLATPAGFSPARTASWAAAGVAVLLALVAAVLWLTDGELSLKVGVLHFGTLPNLGWLILPCAIGAGVSLGLFALLSIGAALVGSPDVDLASEARHGVLAMMVSRPRYGVEKQTPLVSVGLRCRHVRGTFGGAVELWSTKYRFHDDDFHACKASDFGGCDLIIDKGRLYVFATPQAKERWLR